jgi:hypothetical protein
MSLTWETDGHGSTRHVPRGKLVRLWMVSLLIVLQMLAHSGMLDIAESAIDIAQCKQDPERSWEDWKEHEGRHR